MKNAVVLVSGGMDSAVVLAMAREQGFDVYALSVRYGQRHTSELDAAVAVARTQGAVAHKTVNVDLRSIGGSALTDEVPSGSDDVERAFFFRFEGAIPAENRPGVEHHTRVQNDEHQNVSLIE